MTPDRARLRAALGTLLFVLLVPGTVIGVIPWAISRWQLAPPLLALPLMRPLGVLLFAAGLPVFVDFLVRFVVDGLGTPAPIAEPKRLVLTGLFRWLRNPGYVGVVGMLAGQGLYFGSSGVLLWGAFTALVFHAFVVLWEEPHLREKFGAEYEDYCRRVPRWLPRRPR